MSRNLLSISSLPYFTSVPVTTMLLPANAEDAATVATDSSILIPAFSKLSIRSWLVLLANHPLMLAALSGPMPSTAASSSSVALANAFMLINFRASTSATFSPTCLRPNPVSNLARPRDLLAAIPSRRFREDCSPMRSKLASWFNPNLYISASVFTKPVSTSCSTISSPRFSISIALRAA